MTESPPLSLKDLQSLIRNMYGAKDVARGVDGTFMWLMEEVGELAAALREGTPEELALEFSDANKFENDNNIYKCKVKNTNNRSESVV